MRLKPQYRYEQLTVVPNENHIDRFIDEETRTVTLSFSSEFAVEREFGYEVLDHNEKSIDLSRADSMPFLVNHKSDQVAGVVEKVWVEANRGFAQVRLSSSNLGTEIFNDIKDGIRKTISFGYRVLEMVRERSENEKDEIPTYRITRWMPFEISTVSVPADYSVGIGRNNDEDYENEVELIDVSQRDIPNVEVKDKNMDNKEFDVQKERETGIKAERKRLNGIRQTADKVRHLIPDIDALAEDFSNSERTLDEFNAAIVKKMDSIERAAIEKATADQSLGLSQREISNYSVMRLVEALGSNNWKNAGLELEVSLAQADKFGQEARGAYIPFDVLATRADAALTNKASHGSALVPTDFWGSEYVDVLRANSVVAAMGARIIPGLVGDVDIPKGLNEASFGWLTEGGDNDTSPTYSATTVQLSPQDIGGALGFTRKMMKQTGNPAIESIIRDSLNNGIGVFLDKQVLVGTQTGASGLTTQASFTTGDTVVSWADIVDLESQVATQNADFGSLGYVCGPSVRGILKSTVKASGQGGFLMDTDGSVNGYKTMVTSNASTNLYFGNWNDILIPMWGGVDIVVDPYTNVKSGGIVLRAFLATDIAYRNTESFAVQTGITSGT